MRIVGVISMYGVICLAGMIAGPQAARADDCDVASVAAIAQAKVPHAVTHVMTKTGEPPQHFEMIFTGDKAYMQMQGEWHAIPFSAQQQIDLLTQARTQSQQMPHTCQKIANQPINGEAASAYVMQTNANGKQVSARVWIADKSGLPLKSEVHLDDGTAVMDDFRYGNIVAPPGAK
jgi:hypothetical protein